MLLDTGAISMVLFRFLHRMSATSWNLLDSVLSGSRSSATIHVPVRARADREILSQRKAPRYSTGTVVYVARQKVVHVNKLASPQNGDKIVRMV